MILTEPYSIDGIFTFSGFYSEKLFFIPSSVSPLGDGEDHADRPEQVPLPHRRISSEPGEPAGLDEGHGQSRGQVCAFSGLQ